MYQNAQMLCLRHCCTRSSAVADRPRDGSCRWIFRYVTQSHSKWHSSVKHVYSSLLVFHCNCICISYRFWDIHRQKMAWPWNLGQSTLKVIKSLVRFPIPIPWWLWPYLVSFLR